MKFISYKMEMQIAVLKASVQESDRSFKLPNDRPVFLWEDEAHYFTIERDAEFRTTARSKGISVVRLTQDLSNFLDAYGAQGKQLVMA